MFRISYSYGVGPVMYVLTDEPFEWLDTLASLNTIILEVI